MTDELKPMIDERLAEIKHSLSEQKKRTFTTNTVSFSDVVFLVDTIDALVKERDDGFARMHKAQSERNAENDKHITTKMKLATIRQQAMDECAKLAYEYVIEPAPGWSDDEKEGFETGVVDMAMCISQAISALGEKK